MLLLVQGHTPGITDLRDDVESYGINRKFLVSSSSAFVSRFPSCYSPLGYSASAVANCLQVLKGTLLSGTPCLLFVQIS